MQFHHRRPNLCGSATYTAGSVGVSLKFIVGFIGFPGRTEIGREVGIDTSITLIKNMYMYVLLYSKDKMDHRSNSRCWWLLIEHILDVCDLELI